MRESQPLQLLFEAESHVITVELSNGDSYRGVLLSAEENMNLRMAQVTIKAKGGEVSNVDHALIRGSQISFVAFPEFLRYHPMFTQAANEAKE